MNRFIVSLTLALFLTPLSAQEEAAPQEGPSLREKAIEMMSKTPLLTYDKSQALLIAETSYECAGYLNGMQMVVKQMNDEGVLDENVPAQRYIEIAYGFETMHVGLAEIIHLIYEVEPADAMQIKVDQYKLALDNIVKLSPDEIDTKYNFQCSALIQTYLPFIR